MVEASTGSAAVETTLLPAVVADPTEVARIAEAIDVNDRAGISVYGDRAQQSVTDFADKILSQVRNKDLGNTGQLLTDIILKAKNLDPASLKEKGFLGGLFSSFQARLERFKEQFEDVSTQIDRIGLELDRHKDTLRRDIAVLDDLHDETKQSIVRLDAYVQAGKKFVENFRANEVPKLKAAAEAAAGSGGGTLEAQSYQDSLQALDRLEKRVFYLQQARQLGIQQLPQIRIVQSGDETLIENLQATAALTVPAWKQKMVILLGLTQQKSALDMQKTVTDATNKMIREASQMMKDQAISIEEQAQRGVVDIETLQAANTDLIDTIQGVMRVQEEGRTKRAESGEADGPDDGRAQESADCKLSMTVRKALPLALMLVAFGAALAACGRDPTPFAIVSGSENTALEPIVQEFCEKQNFSCDFKYEGSLDIGLALQGRRGHAGRGVAGIERLGRPVRQRPQGPQPHLDRADAGHSGRAQIEGRGARLDRQGRVHEGHPGGGHQRQAEISDDVCDAVEFRRQRLSVDAVQRAWRQGSDRARRSRQSLGARYGERAAQGGRALLGLVRLARRPLCHIGPKRGRPTTPCGTTRRS